MWDFDLAANLRSIRCRRLPFVKTVCQDQAAVVTERGAEGRLLGQRLGAGVDQPGADGRVFCPRGDQPPDEEIRPARAVVGDDQHRLRGGDVETRCKLSRKGEFGEGILQVGRVNG